MFRRGRRRRVLVALLSLVCVAAVVVPALAPAQPRASGARALQPKLGKSVLVSPDGGQVTVREPRQAGSFDLRKPTLIPVGSAVDTTRGHVMMQTAGLAPGSRQKGVFSGGAFVVTQRPSSLVDLALTAESRAERTLCGGATIARKRRRRHLNARVLQSLQANAHGNFETTGKYAAATVRGTVWTTADQCDGTLITSNHGAVSTTSNGGQTTTIHTGESQLLYCVPHIGVHRFLAGHGDYCVDLTANPVSGIEGYGVVTHRPSRTFGICIDPPIGKTACHTASMWPSGLAANVQEQIVACAQGPKGAYTATYTLDGQTIATLPFVATRPLRDTTIGKTGIVLCVEDFGGPAPTSFNEDYATINACHPANLPGVLGVAASMPPTVDPAEEMFMRFRAQERDPFGDWVNVPGQNSGFMDLGNSSGQRTVTNAFHLPAGFSGVVRGSVDLQWRIAGVAQATITVTTSAGHATPGADPPGFSQATCTFP